MRDVGTLVWVVLVIIGVISSMVSSVRKQARGQERPQFTVPPARPAPAPPPPSVAPRPQPPAPRAAPARAEPQAAGDHTAEPASRKNGLFARKGALVRAVIAMEVLGKPRGLSDEHFPR